MPWYYYLKIKQDGRRRQCCLVLDWQEKSHHHAEWTKIKINTKPIELHTVILPQTEQSFLVLQLTTIPCSSIKGIGRWSGPSSGRGGSTWRNRWSYWRRDSRQWCICLTVRISCVTSQSTNIKYWSLVDIITLTGADVRSKLSFVFGVW